MTSFLRLRRDRKCSLHALGPTIFIAESRDANFVDFELTLLRSRIVISENSPWYKALGSRSPTLWNSTQFYVALHLSAFRLSVFCATSFLRLCRVCSAVYTRMTANRFIALKREEDVEYRVTMKLAGKLIKSIYPMFLYLSYICRWMQMYLLYFYFEI